MEEKNLKLKADKMMNVQIISDQTETLSNSTYRTIELECGKRQAVVMIAPDYVSVICKNAAHRVWMGAPKCYENFEAAIANYKSSSMKAIIETVQEMKAAQ